MTILLLTVPVLLLILLLWLRRGSALNRAAQELCEARAQPGKRLRLLSPDRQVENLLAQINGLLEDREQETRTLREQEESLRYRSPTSLTTCAPHLPPFLAISSFWNRSSFPLSSGDII